MKIMTLNTHSLAEPEYESKLAAFAGSLVQIKPDIIALQEVNQSMSAPPAASALPPLCRVPAIRASFRLPDSCFGRRAPLSRLSSPWSGKMVCWSVCIPRRREPSR